MRPKSDPVFSGRQGAGLRTREEAPVRKIGDVTALVDLQAVTKRFGGGPLVLDRVSIAVEEGSILALLGASGSGKTTALRLINRLTEPDDGAVIVLGKPARDWDAIELRRRIGYVIQEGGRATAHAAAGACHLDQFGLAARATDWRGNNNIAESIIGQLCRETHPEPRWIVCGAGTGGTSATIGRYLRYRRLSTQLCVAEPRGGAYAEGWRRRDRAAQATQPTVRHRPPCGRAGFPLRDRRSRLRGRRCRLDSGCLAAPIPARTPLRRILGNESHRLPRARGRHARTL